MNHKENVEKAIAAHGLWKQRLLSAISTGQSDFKVEKVQEDNLCDFGKWFYGLPSTVVESEQGKKIKDLHAKFHKEAARILAIALSGKKDEAVQLLEKGSQYAKISGQLTLSLITWKETIDNK